VALEVHRGIKTGADDLSDLDAAADAQQPAAVRVDKFSPAPVLVSSNSDGKPTCVKKQMPSHLAPHPYDSQILICLPLVLSVVLRRGTVHASYEVPTGTACPEQAVSRAAARRGPVDVFGQHIPPVATDLVACTNCGKRMAAARCAA
jgi:hypothetical protein